MHNTKPNLSKPMLVALAAVAAMGLAHDAEAGSVRGYMRSDGTYVAPHYRSAPDSSVTNNYSYRGNTNPYTGDTGSNSYHNSPNSPYYNGSADD